jgi:hypothetical protein
MGGSRHGWALLAIALALLGASGWMVYQIAFSGDEAAANANGEPGAVASGGGGDERPVRQGLPRDPATQAGRPVHRVVPRAVAAERDSDEQEPDTEQPVSLTPQQRLALKATLDGFYSADDLAAALRSRTAPDYAREVSHEFFEAYAAEALEIDRGSVPVTPEVKQVLSRMGVVKDYVMNMLHTMRQPGQEALQQKLMDDINGSFGVRIDQLNADYPFLAVQKVESL